MYILSVLDHPYFYISVGSSFQSSMSLTLSYVLSFYCCAIFWLISLDLSFVLLSVFSATVSYQLFNFSTELVISKLSMSASKEYF